MQPAFILDRRRLWPRSCPFTMPSVMNVCILLDAFDHISGISVTYRSQLYLAASAGVCLTVIAPVARGVSPCVEEIAGSRLVRVGARWSVHFPVDRNIRLDWPDWQQIRRAVEAAKPDIIQAATPGPVGVYAPRLARKLGVPSVGYFHTDYLSMQHPRVLAAVYPNPIVRRAASFISQTFTRIAERMMYTHCDVVLCEAQKTADQVRRRRLNAHPILVPATLRHDLDPVHADGAAFRRRWDIPNGRKVALFVGRFAPDKNLPLVAEAARRCPEITFVAVGTGPLAHLLEGLSNVVVTGPLNGVELWSAYAAADVLLMTSWAETFGLVSLEAMAMSLPVLTADTAGSAPEVLSAGAGCTFSPADTDGFIAELRDLLADEARLEKYRANARAWAAQNRPEARYRRLVEMAYKPLMGSR